MADNNSPEQQKAEVQEKRNKILQLMERQQLDGLVLGRQNNFAWATGGGTSWINIATDLGAAQLVFSKNGQSFVVIQNIEGPRFEEEEKLRELGFTPVLIPWWEGPEERRQKMLDLVGGGTTRLAADYPLDNTINLSGVLARQRWSLTPHEQDRFRELGQLSGDALESVTAGLKPGMSEWEIAGKLAEASYRRGVVPVVTLVATDERIWRYRHPVPTGKKLEKYAMLVLCGRRGGLIASCTRLVHFGPLEAELAKRHAAVQRVDAIFNLATRPGEIASHIFGKALEEYARAGFPDEWQLHHQGGATGYEPRDYVGSATIQETVLDGQAFAWNPSITGTKSEDTILVSNAKGLEVLTQPIASNWPLKEVEIEGLGAIKRPEILVL
jgi:antitoxin VapB